MVKRLKAPTGADEATFGTERFRVENDGTVEVPDEAVPSLTTVGGFVEETAPEPVPDGMVRMLHDDLTAQVAVDGKSYAAGKDGVFVVPLHAVGALISHGFSLAPEADAIDANPDK